MTALNGLILSIDRALTLYSITIFEVVPVLWVKAQYAKEIGGLLKVSSLVKFRVCGIICPLICLNRDFFKLTAITSNIDEPILIICVFPLCSTLFNVKARRLRL